jgi:ferredoxin
MIESLDTQVKDAGFDAYGISGVEPLIQWTGREGLSLERDVQAIDPEAKSLLILVEFVPPFETEGGIAAYYAASTRAYHGAHALAQKLGGVHVPRIPLRTAALRIGLGGVGKNQLMIHPESGTVPYLQAISLHEELPYAYHELNVCLNCGACVRACPTGALNDGFDQSKCLRKHMAASVPPPEYMRPLMGNRVVGCEICQRACPLLSARQPDLPEEERLSFEKILNGVPDGEVRELLGVNTNPNTILAAAAIAASSEILSPTMMQPFCEPFSRRMRVRRRVSIPAIATTLLAFR